MAEDTKDDDAEMRAFAAKLGLTLPPKSLPPWIAGSGFREVTLPEMNEEEITEDPDWPGIMTF